MTGDIKLEITITAEAVDRILSLLGLREEKREETSSPTPPTKEERKEESQYTFSSNNIRHHTDNSNNNISSVVGDVVKAINPASTLCNNVSVDEDLLSKELKPPTKEDVVRYIVQHNYTVDPDRFYYYYSNLGWKKKDGTSILGSWRETIDSWTKNGRTNATATTMPVDKNNREALRATHPFTPTEFD